MYVHDGAKLKCRFKTNYAEWKFNLFDANSYTRNYNLNRLAQKSGSIWEWEDNSGINRSKPTISSYGKEIVSRAFSAFMNRSIPFFVTESQESNTNLFKFENELLFIICWRTLLVSEWQSIMERLVSTWAVDKRQSKSSDGIWNSSQLRIFSVFSLFKAKSDLNLFWLFPRQIVVWRQESRFKYFKFGHNSTKREASTSNNLLARRFSLQMEMPRNFKRGSMPSSKVNRTFDDSVLTFIQSFHYIEIMYLLLISFCCCRQHINRPSQWPTQNW